MRFDWYSATIKHPFENLNGCFAERFGWALPEEIRPFTRYNRAIEYRCGEDKVVRIDSNDELRHCLVTATSDNAPRVAGYLRECWPDHLVSRADVCEDYTGEGVFEKLDGLYVRLAVSEGLVLDQAGDWLRENGRTRYIGGKSSTTRVRVYEKGWQQVADAKKSGQPLPEGFDITRTRVETQVRPQSRDKSSASKWSAAQIMCYSSWTQRAQSLLAGFEVAAPLKQLRPPSDHDRKLHHLFKQYGKTLLAEFDRLDGSFECLGKVIVEGVHLAQERSTRLANIATGKQ